MRVVIAGGGTGGHVFPALAVADELKGRMEGAQITFVGGQRGLETRLVPQAGYPLRTLRMSGLKGATVASRVAAAGMAGAALVRCLGWMAVKRPHLVIGVGGYASGPAVLAAKVLGVKTMILEQNHFPGATNRWLAPRVDAVCVPSEAARGRLGGRGIVTGNPVREAFTRIGPAPGRPALSLLVFGGSRGARSINRAVVEALPALASMEPAPTIVHQTGSDALEEVRGAYAGFPALSSAHVAPFLDDMPQRLADADLVVARAGATTLAELAAAGRPAVLVPYPHAADDHQRLNAEAVAEAGAAVWILDRELSGTGLAAIVTALAGDRGHLRRMGEAARSLAHPDAAARIADVAQSLLAGGARVP
ncbi:MAG TPA: undecaprenyldiphospho-muramoylpentapeptide beta-N-acetylglucosaminyltransferase [Candidatus Polarisedimenticolaceae bacterium]|nr:undecaprenyldiphospho-muramoylpentapeptide beta-N-acetylglucosaminyltransferase [Candidatus Polarisedimenticolaceae bacterium]